MKKVVQIVVICLMLLAAKNTSALTVSKTVRWHGGWCSLCNFTTYGQEYCCAWNPWYNFYSGDTNDTAWNCTNCRGFFGGYKYYLDPLPSGATVTGIDVAVCEADCGDSYVNVSMNGVSVGTYYPTGNCYCGGTYTFTLTATNVSAIMAAYHVGNMDTINVMPNSTMCFSTAQIIFTYVLGANLNTYNSQYIHNIPYCPGDSLNVPYYAAGSWNNGNVFSAQLSNSSGSFASPTVIGTLSSTTSGTIHCLIPSNTALGTGYSIRVVGNNPTTVGSDTVMNITISNAAPSITANGPLHFCSGGNVVLTASTGQSYLWSPGGQTTQSITVTAAGYYHVFVANASGCSGTSTNDTVVISPVPTSPTLLYGPDVLCGQSVAAFSTPIISNATSYHWTVSGPYSVYGDTIISGQGTQNCAIHFGNINYNVIKVWAVNACGTSSTYAEKDLTLIVGEPDGTWIGGISNDWFVSGNWCGPVPTPSIDVNIDGTFPYTQVWYNQNMPVINAAGATCHNLTLQGLGISYANNAYESLTMQNSFELDIYGDFTNNANMGYSVFNPGTGTVKFTGDGDNLYYEGYNNAAGNLISYAHGNMITGYSNTHFYNLIVDKGSDVSTVLENTGGGIWDSFNNRPAENIISVTGALSIVNGNFLLSQDSSTVSLPTTSFTIPSTGGLDFNGGWLNSTSTSVTNNGDFIMDYFAYPVTVGSAADNAFTNNGNFEIYGGKLTLASQLISSGSTSHFTFDDASQSPCACPSTLTLNSVGTTSNTKALFDVSGNANMDFLNGTIIFEKANQGTLPAKGNDLRLLSGSGTKTIGTATFQFGDANTPTNTVFRLKDSLNIALNNVIINAYNTPKVKLDTSLTIGGTLSLTNSVLDLNSHLLTMSYNQPGAITNSSSPYGYIISEDSLNRAAINWTVALQSQEYKFPFGNNSGAYIPVKFINNSATSMNVQIATYAPTRWGHQPYPPTVAQIRDSAGTHLNDSSNMVNRFWEITAPTVSSTNTAKVDFYYAYAERPANGDAGGLRAQRYVASNNGWLYPSLVYSSGGSNGSLGSSTSYQTSSSTTTGYTRVNNLNHCSSWTLTVPGHPLPIELLKFTAQYNGKTVDLNWSTASELNNEYFTVSKTKDQAEFDFVAQVLGAGNSNIQNDYYAEDKAPFLGTSYYKLTQTDFNGNSTQSGLVPVFIGDNGFNIVNINNDNTKGIINIYLNDNSSEKVSAVVYDVLGNQMQNTSIITAKGINHIEVNSDQFAKGVYFISISNNSQRLTGKIAK